MGTHFSDWVENTVGKEEIARYEQSLLFPQCFQKLSFVDALKWVSVEWRVNTPWTWHFNQKKKSLRGDKSWTVGCRKLCLAQLQYTINVSNNIQYNSRKTRSSQQKITSILYTVTWMDAWMDRLARSSMPQKTFVLRGYNNVLFAIKF